MTEQLAERSFIGDWELEPAHGEAKTPFARKDEAGAVVLKRRGADA